MVKIVEKEINDIFDITLSNGDNKPDDLPKGDIPLVSSGSENQGIVGKFNTWTTIYPKYSLTIDMFGNAYMHAYKYQTVSHGRINILLYKNSKYAKPEIGLYLATAINKVTQTGQYGFSNMLSSKKINPLKIKVPVTPTGKLDTAYMASYVQKIEASYVQKIEASYVQKIEASYVQKIEAYLAVLGYKSLADCQINQHDLDVLHAKPKMGKIKVNSLFSISKLKGLNKNDLNINNKGKYPYITRTAQNNGVESYTDFVDNEHLQPAGTFSLGLMQMSLFYQSKPWYNGQFVRKITPTKNYNSKELMFLQAHLQKLTNLFDPQAIRKVDDVFNKASFTLPVTSSGTPDWQFMEDYITAIEKLKVLKIKQFLDTKINAYQAIIK